MNAPLGWVYLGQYYSAGPTVSITGVRALATGAGKAGSISLSLGGTRALATASAKVGSVSLGIGGTRALASAVANPGAIPQYATVIGTRALAYARANADWDCRIRYLDPLPSDDLALDLDEVIDQILDPVSSTVGQLNPDFSGNGALDPVSSRGVSLDPLSSSCR